MAIDKISDFAIGDSNLNAMMQTLNKAYKGQAQVTLSEYDTDLAPVVKIGSVFDNNGTQYSVSGADETPTGYTAIAVSTTFYLYFDSVNIAFIYDSTVPVWSDDLQGWYNGNNRALFSMYKDSGGTLYQNKSKLRDPVEMENITIGNNLSIDNNLSVYNYAYIGGKIRFNSSIIWGSDSIGSIEIKDAIINSGSWDMDANSTLSIDIDPIQVNDILFIQAKVYNDASGTSIGQPVYPLNYSGVIELYNSGTTLTLLRTTGGIFDSTDYDDTTINRCKIFMIYRI